jgi:diguanylate cyclase (GGDEF)-like protein/PAS domain S-box-containing protein
MTESRYRRLDDPETLRVLVRRLPAAVYITTEAGDILDANPAMLRLMGCKTVDELRSFRADELLVGGRSRRQRQRDLLDQSGVCEQELRLRRPDGQYRTVIDTCHLLRDPESGEVLYHGILIDITERKMFEQQLKEMSNRDPLTGCFNRRYLHETEPRLIEERAEWGVIVVDIDHFKRYNDERGHQAGDEALVTVAQYLLRETRAQDAVVRLGGDEFLVLLLGEQAPATAAIAARLRAPGDDACSVPFSIGWGVRRKDETLERTIQRADRRLIETRALERRDRRPGRTREIYGTRPADL